MAVRFSLTPALLLLAALAALSAPAAALNRTVTCETDAYPPPASRALPTAVVDLDLEPIARWQALGKQYSAELKSLLDIVYDVPILGRDGREVLEWIDKEFGPLDQRLPQPYADEVRGLSQASGVPLGELVLINIFYEIFTVCTSIVAQDANGHVMHGRNLDFGLFPAYNWTDHQWELTQKLRPLMVDVAFEQNGKLLFRSVHFIGYVGVLSAMKPGVFSVTVDDRFDYQFDIGLLEWLLHLTPRAQFIGFFLRDQMLHATSYEGALTALNNTRLIAPVYFIMSGPKAGQGAVIAREKKESVDVWPLQQQLSAGSFYLLETNYDHWEQPPFFDNRRDPGMQCMNETGAQNINFGTLYNVLDTKPVRNQLTTYTVLMSVATGDWEVYMQFCDKPCAPW